jgi:hypothetical protein
VTTTADLARLLGRDALETLSAAWGGTHIDLPRRPEGRQWRALADLIGPEAAARLLDEWGGDRVEIPRLCAHTRARRDRRLRHQRQHGATLRALALEHRLTTRRVRQILAEDPPPHQGDLFGDD